MTPVTVWPGALAHMRVAWAASAEEGLIAPSTHARYLQIYESLCGYATATGMDLVDPGSSLRRFIWAPLRGDAQVSESTARLRLTVLRAAYQALVARGLLSADPTEGLSVPHTPAAFAPRPLTPPEAARLLRVGRLSPSDTLRPATVALALTGGTHSEIGACVHGDLDPESRTLTLGAGRSRRHVYVDPEIAGVLLARAATTRRGTGGRLPEPSGGWPFALNRPVAEYRHDSLIASVGGNLARALVCAGITRAHVRPKSIREFAANRMYAESGSIEQLATNLGMSSLDAASRLIDRDWQHQWGGVVRATAGSDD